MSSKKQNSAIALVMAATASRARPPQTWVDRLPQDGQREMEELRQAWRSGPLKGTPITHVFDGVVQRCKEESWPAPKSTNTIKRWLLLSE